VTSITFVGNWNIIIPSRMTGSKLFKWQKSRVEPRIGRTTRKVLSVTIYKTVSYNWYRKMGGELLQLFKIRVV
jgi:hypothetical protein